METSVHIFDFYAYILNAWLPCSKPTFGIMLMWTKLKICMKELCRKHKMIQLFFLWKLKKLKQALESLYKWNHMVVERKKGQRGFYPCENWIKEKLVWSQNFRYRTILLSDIFSLAWYIQVSMYLLPWMVLSRSLRWLDFEYLSITVCMLTVVLVR